MSTYLNNAIDDMINHPPQALPPALLSVEQEYKDQLTNAVNNGLEADKVMKMNLIMVICLNRGLTVEDLQAQQLLFTNLLIETNFSTTDANINRMVNLIQNAQQNQ